MNEKKCIHIHTDHAGFSSMKLLNKDLEKGGFASDMLIFAYFKKDMSYALSALTEVEFEQLQTACVEYIDKLKRDGIFLTPMNYRSIPFSATDVKRMSQTLASKQINLSLSTESSPLFLINMPNMQSPLQQQLTAFYDSFCEQNQLPSKLFLTAQQFAYFISELKRLKLDTDIRADSLAWYLFGDLNLGDPDSPHMSVLFEQIVRACAESLDSILNLYPYSQNKEAREDANLYLSGKKTATYTIQGQSLGGFCLTTPVRGFSAEKNKIVKMLQTEEKPLMSEEHGDGSRSSIVSPGEPITIRNGKTESQDKSANILSSNVSPVPNQPTTTVKKKPWYEGWSCLFSTTSKKVKPVLTNNEPKSSEKEGGPDAKKN